MATLFQFGFLLKSHHATPGLGTSVSVDPSHGGAGDKEWCYGLHDTRYTSDRRAIWQTIRGSVGKNSFINEYVLLMAGTESQLARVPS